MNGSKNMASRLHHSVPLVRVEKWLRRAVLRSAKVHKGLSITRRPEEGKVGKKSWEEGCFASGFTFPGTDLNLQICLRRVRKSLNSQQSSVKKDEPTL